MEEDESNLDRKKKKEKYATTSDGYKSVKKMSISNGDYSTVSKELSKIPVNVQPLEFAGIKPKIDVGKFRNFPRILFSSFKKIDKNCNQISSKTVEY